MRTDDHYAGPRRGAYVALIFFACIIAYYLWVRADPLSWMHRKPAPVTPPRPPLVEAAPLMGGDSAMPTAQVRMKVKRIEKRKYRREGSAPPPSVVRPTPTP